MKHLLFLFLFIPAILSGQDTTRIATGTLKFASDWRWAQGITYDTITHFDTIPVVMLVCDTARIKTDSMLHKYSFDGGEITYIEKDHTWKEWVRTSKFKENLGPTKLISIEPIYRYDPTVTWIKGYKAGDRYLDADKKPLKKVVWMSKNL